MQIFSLTLKPLFFLLWEKFFSKFTFTCLCFKIPLGSKVLEGSSVIQGYFHIWSQSGPWGPVFQLGTGTGCSFFHLPLLTEGTVWCRHSNILYSSSLWSQEGRNLVSWKGTRVRTLRDRNGQRGRVLLCSSQAGSYPTVSCTDSP